MNKNENEKIIIYQVFTRLFGNDCQRRVWNGDKAINGCGTMADFTHRALASIKELGATHIWYTGIIEHATQTNYTDQGIAVDHASVVKGKAGSPYAIKDYYDVTPDLAKVPAKRMKEFENLVKRTHKEGLRVIIDFVPNHVARQYRSDQLPQGVADLGTKDDVTQPFSAQNNFYYIPGEIWAVPAATDLPTDLLAYKEYPAKATGNDVFSAYPTANDWYETVKLNYGVDYQGGWQKHFSPMPDTWHKMRDILLFWASKEVDGFRCDMAEMVPVEFWEWVIPQVKVAYPHLLFIAEVYNPALYGAYLDQGKFDYLYDKVGLYDTLRHIVSGHGSATAITQAWQALQGREKQMLNFLENHDEQRIASTFFADDARKAFPALLVSACMQTNPFMVYFGQELGEAGMDEEGFSGKDGRTTIFDYWSVDTIRRWRAGGSYDGSLLTEEEKEIRAFYQRVLTLCQEEKAIKEGAFFDLMYANINGWRFNEHRQYAFFRKAEKELLFIVVNFDGFPAEVAVNIPSHAFDYLQIPQATGYAAVDLLTGRSEELNLLPYEATTVTLPAYGGKVLKVVLP